MRKSETWLWNLVAASNALERARLGWLAYEDRALAALQTARATGTVQPSSGGNVALEEVNKGLELLEAWRQTCTPSPGDYRHHAGSVGGSLQAFGLDLEVAVWQLQVRLPDEFQAALGRYNGIGIGAAAAGYQTVRSAGGRGARSSSTGRSSRRAR